MSDVMSDDDLWHAVGLIRDRQEIAEALARYSRGLDDRQWDEWDGLFTEDARLDYSSIGLGVLTPAEFRAHVTGNDGVRVAGQHLHSNLLVDVDGDAATVRAEFTMVNIVRADEPGTGTMVRAGGGCGYELTRTEGVWRIRTRSTSSKWVTREVIPL